MSSSSGAVEVDRWFDAWEAGRTGWKYEEKVNQPQVNYEWLAQHLPPTSQTVLVPLCGDSSIIDTFYAAGHTVIGIELSSIALRAVMERLPVDFEEPHTEGELIVHRSQDGRVELWEGDLFKFKLPAQDDAEGEEEDGKGQAGPVTLVYDRASMVAIQPELRGAYVEVLSTALSPGARFFLSTMVRETDDGPPFSIDFEQACDILGRDKWVLEADGKELNKKTPDRLSAETRNWLFRSK